jgi:hypothetical protein
LQSVCVSLRLTELKAQPVYVSLHPQAADKANATPKDKSSKKKRKHKKMEAMQAGNVVSGLKKMKKIE